MSDFVEQCRHEWERLRVPDQVANEMAADLEADLQEAAAEGVAAEELLGRSAFDPRSFAASWAAERGVIPPPPHREHHPREPLALAALATLAVVAVIGLALALLTSSNTGSVATAPMFVPRSGGAGPLAPPAPSGPFVLHGGPFALDALAWILLVLVTILGVIVAGWLWSRWVRLRPPIAPA